MKTGQRVRIIGPGRAGRSLAAALVGAGWFVYEFLDRTSSLYDAAVGADVVVIATPDDAIQEVSEAIAPHCDSVVMHLSGSLGMDVLYPHKRRATLHPLTTLANPTIGADRLCSGITMAISGDPVARDIAESLGARVIEIDDQDRAAYHAAACIASNHVVALLGQVERICESIGIDWRIFIELTRAAVDDALLLGPGLALTGPASRGDFLTLERHRAALAVGEREAYDALARLASGKGVESRKSSKSGELVGLSGLYEHCDELEATLS